MGLFTRSGVAVVEFFGPIGSGGQVAEMARLLDDVGKKPHYQALVLDIDSPGGAVGGAEVLHARITKIAEAKPVVAFVRSMGASGGYYLACAASKIITLPSSLVGSIGVIYLRPAMQELLEKLGVNLTVYKGGRYKDMTGFWRGPTPEEDDKFRSLIAEIHDNFIDVVAKGRKMPPERVRELATGEIFTGRRARDLGLVDEIGDFDRALEIAGRMGDVQPRPLYIRPKRGLLERMAGRFGRGMAAGVAAELEARMGGGFYYKLP
ncbi:MAG: signal peptide peptidase SppA [SAR202 cluster bacterium]|nr:signal peptide peptidase SppA [SAR202 cluster bacterium]